MQCVVCNQPLKLIPAGFSKKTGKNYDAFYVCADPSHKQPRLTKPIQQFEKKLDEENVDEKFRKIREEKSEGMRLGNAKSNATLLVAHGVISLEDWKMWVKQIYDFEL